MVITNRSGWLLELLTELTKRYKEIQIQTETNAAKNSGWCSALKEREKSLSASEKSSLSGAGQTLARETVKPTLPRDKYVVIRIFKEFGEGKTKIFF